MEVTVKGFLFIRDMLGFPEKVFILADGSTVEDILRILTDNYGLKEKFVMKGHTFTLLKKGQPQDLIVLIYGKNIKRMSGLSTVIENGSTVALFPPVAGG